MTRTYIEKPEAGPGGKTSLTIEPAMALLAPAIAPHCVLAEVGKHGAAAASYRSQTIGTTGQLPERDFRVECLEYSGAPTLGAAAMAGNIAIAITSIARTTTRPSTLCDIDLRKRRL
jgi:hypothetical protein